MAHGLQHAPDLPVAALVDGDGNARIPLLVCGGVVDAGGGGHAVLQHDAVDKLGALLGGELPVADGVVGLLHLELRMGHLVAQVPVVGHEEQALGI